jgi:hypothetical protein
MQKTSTVHFQRKKSIVMDDEKHFTFGNPEISANTGFWTKNNKDMAPNNVKYKSKAKFEPNILVWLAISQYGVSTPLISLRKGKAVDADVYVKVCMLQLKKIIQKHPNDQIIFWPHLTSSYYAIKRGNGLMTTKKFLFQTT